MVDFCHTKYFTIITCHTTIRPVSCYESVWGYESCPFKKKACDV